MQAFEETAIDHGGLYVIDRETCDHLLHTHQIGRIGFVAAGDVVVLPVNYRYHRQTIVFLTGSGDKLRIAEGGAGGAFEIDGWEPDGSAGWSVLVKGRLEEVPTTETDELARLGLRPWAGETDRTNWVRLRPTEITGRRFA